MSNVFIVMVLKALANKQFSTAWRTTKSEMKRSKKENAGAQRKKEEKKLEDLLDQVIVSYKSRYQLCQLKCRTKKKMLDKIMVFQIPVQTCTYVIIIYGTRSTRFCTHNTYTSKHRITSPGNIHTNDAPSICKLWYRLKRTHTNRL